MRRRLCRRSWSACGARSPRCDLADPGSWSDRREDLTGDDLITFVQFVGDDVGMAAVTEAGFDGNLLRLAVGKNPYGGHARFPVTAFASASTFGARTAA